MYAALKRLSLIPLLALLFTCGAYVHGYAACSGATNGTPATAAFMLSNDFQNGRAAGSITPDCMRDVIASGAGNASNIINLKNLGLPTGGDDTTAINNALASAKSGGQSVYAPAGTYKHNNVIIADSVCLFGDGDSTIFQATDSSTGNVAMILEGTAPCLRNVKLTTTYAAASGRLAADANMAVSVVTDLNSASVTNYLVQGVHVAGTTANPFPAAGIFQAGHEVYTQTVQFGRVTGNFVENTLADGIHVCCAAQDITETGNIVEHSGDDCYPVVTYVSGAAAPTRNITISGNVCRDGQARGLVVEGGQNIAFSGNELYNLTTPGGFCMLAAGDTGQAAVDGVSFTGNVCRNVGGGTNATVQVYSGVTGQNVKNVSMVGNTIANTTNTCVAVFAFTAGVTTANFRFSGNTCEGTGSGYGFVCSTNTGTLKDMIVTDNIFNNLSSGIDTSGCSATIDNANNLINTD